MKTAKKTRSIRKFVKSSLSQRRWVHSLGVARLMNKLSDVYGYSHPDKLVEIALLHDNARDLPFPKQRELANKYFGEIDEIRGRYKVLLHGPAGAQRLIDEMSYKRESRVVHTIAYHSTGQPNPSKELQYLLVADFAEVNRDHESASRIRNLIGKKNLRDLVRLVVKNKIEYCLNQAKPVHTLSLATYNQLCD